MKISDAPPAGWYPDPEGGARLRWWEGTDWSDRYRARPTEMRAVPMGQATPGGSSGQPASWSQMPPMNASQMGQYAQQLAGQGGNAELVEQVRRAAREEAQRASQLFGQQARAATRNFVPLITEYTTKVTRVLRVLAILATILLIGWLMFQLFAQQSLFDWFGDRIDNLTDDDSAGAVLVTFRR